MSDEAAEVRKLITPFRLQPLSLEVSPSAEERRRRVVARVQSLARQRASGRFGRRRPLWVAAAAAALASAAVFAFAYRPNAAPERPASIEIAVLSGRAVHATRGGHTVVTAGERRVAEAGGQLSTMGGGRAHVTHPAGLSIDVEPQTVLAFPEGGFDVQGRRELRLSTGGITLRVAKQPVGQSLWVLTPDARVIVKGTVFSVMVRPSDQGPSTCVRVVEGVVAVQGTYSGATLSAGQRWGCEAPPTARDTPSSGPSAGPQQPDDTVSVRAGRSPGASGALAEQNRLLVEAIAAERRGSHVEAERKLQALLSRHPGSPLARDARVALDRVRAAQRR